MPGLPKKETCGQSQRIGIQESDSGFRKGHVCGNALWSFLCRVPLYVGTFIWQYNVRIHVPTYRTVALYGCIPTGDRGLFFMLPQSRNPDSPHPDPGIVHRSLSWEFPGNSGQKSNDDDSHHRIPGCSWQWSAFQSSRNLHSNQQEHLPIVPGSDCTHTVFTDRAARWHAPVSHHWHRFAPAQRGAAGPRDTVLLLTAASSCMCAQAGGMREPLRPAAPSPANQAHTGRPRVQSTTTRRQSSRCSTSGFMQTTTTRSRMAEPKPSWLRAQVSACCPAVVRPGSCVPR